MKATIERTDNGYIVTTDDGSLSFEDNVAGPFALKDALYAVCEGVGYFGSKHDDCRLWIRVEDQEGNDLFLSHVIIK